MKKRRLKRKWKKYLLNLILTLFIIGFGISTYKIVIYKMEENKIKNQLDEINGKMDIKEIEDTSEVKIIEQEEIPASNPYWDYIKMKLIDVNFNELKEMNSSTVGWIQMNGTNINYPFVQANDNQYYLTHSFDKSYNSAGWVFLDYRNSKTEPDKNNIIYAHGRLDKTMFGSLKNILSSNWLKDSNNYIVKTATENYNALWQVFSVYRIPTTNDYLQINFTNNDQFLNFANMLLDRSSHNFNTSINENDKILTLSTCYNNDEKVVLHAKLIKIEEK